ncbi:MAG: MbtH family protein [Dyella sp.]|uniref:MbtH family protein n=1 Tax=Dyella sp. TaxID=1869338 RepID=UPI003F7D1462
MTFSDDGEETFVVLINDELQYSLWPASSDVPAGWRLVRDEGTRKECVDFVEMHWTDMRPKSVMDAR